jgi:hypothetical protein
MARHIWSVLTSSALPIRFWAPVIVRSILSEPEVDRRQKQSYRSTQILGADPSAKKNLD